MIGKKICRFRGPTYGRQASEAWALHLSYEDSVILPVSLSTVGTGDVPEVEFSCLA